MECAESPVERIGITRSSIVDKSVRQSLCACNTIQRLLVKNSDTYLRVAEKLFSFHALPPVIDLAPTRDQILFLTRTEAEYRKNTVMNCPCYLAGSAHWWAGPATSASRLTEAAALPMGIGNEGTHAAASGRHRRTPGMTGILWAKEANDGTVAGHVAAAMAGGGLLVVPGGTTPRPILARLAGRRLPWDRITLTLTDDRDVPHDHPASNFGALASALGTTGADLRPLREGAAPGRARLLWFGMGEDGHVASLFPNLSLDPSDPPAVVRTLPDPLPPEAPFARLTLNYAALADADHIILVARGAAKRRRIEEAMAGQSGLPIARLIGALRTPLTVFWKD